MRSTNLLIVAVAAGLLVAGCAHEKLRSDYGKSTQINRDAQVVDPAASSRDYPVSTSDGRKVEATLDRYRKDKTDDSRAKVVSGTGQ